MEMKFQVKKQKYKKLKSGIKYARAHLVEVKCELDRLENLMVRLEGASGEEEISKILGENHLRIFKDIVG